MNIVAHNLLAMNAQRQFGINTRSKAKSTEKLSSGYKINRAADDAAGLAISEKMRRQIRGLEQGVSNSQDGVSLCQVADGALAEVNEMLHRITELSVKAANETNTEEDRDAIQEEINQILREIDRIGDTTTFNEQKIFEGNVNTIGNFSPDSMSSNITINRNYKVEGVPVDKSILDYKINADINGGITLNGNIYSWDKISSTSGNNLGEQDITPDTYFVECNGLKIAFDVTEHDDINTIANALDKLSIHMDYTPPKTNGINSVSFKLYTPTESANISKTEFSSFIRKDEHTVIADSNGVKIDDNGNIKTWSSIFMEAGITEEEALNNGGTINIGETGKYDLNITFKPGMTTDDIIDEINGMTFKVNGTIADNTVVNAYNPCNTAITASCTNFSLSPALTEALGYDVLYGDIVMKAVYNDSGRTDAYPNGIRLEFVCNSEVVSSVKNGYLVATKESMDNLAQIFSTGQTTSAGSVKIDFISPSYPITPTYGNSNVSITWNYPVGINERDLWNAVGSGSPSPLFGADALDLTIKTNYSTEGLQVNNIDVPEKIAFKVDDSNVNNSITLPTSTSNNAKTSLQLWIQSGCEAGDGMFLEIDRMNNTILGINGLDVSTVDGANHAMEAVKGALQKVSANRSKIGAQQNRLEHTIANGENALENTTAAESRIRDTDMAKEMVHFASLNILEQVGQAMMAQANQSNQGVLSLLQ